MASKSNEDQANGSSKPARKGFQVGPVNLPDGPQRRKLQKIKRSLIRKAQLNKELSRARATVEGIAQNQIEEPASMEPHPDRQILMSTPNEPDYSSRPAKGRRKGPPKPQTFGREVQDAEQRRKEREQAEAARKKALQDRDRIRKAVAKARKPGKDGKRKLGRESTVLLEKVKKMVNS